VYAQSFGILLPFRWGLANAFTHNASIKEERASENAGDNIAPRGVPHRQNVDNHSRSVVSCRLIKVRVGDYRFLLT
jgi:hypothetical protein